MENKINKIIKELNDNALYKISMSSIELFHSNFWDWMFSKYKESIQYFFEDIVHFDDMSDVKSKREHKHLDILIEDTNYFYIIENKIKSLPDEEQLRRYGEKTIYKKVFKKGIIASIIEIDLSENFKNEGKWVSLGYKEIAMRIKKFRDDYINYHNDYDTFDFDLIEKYYNMIYGISLLVQNEIADKTRYQLNTKLNEIGFGVVYRKLMGSVLKSEFLKNDSLMRFKPFFQQEGIYPSINRAKLTFSIHLQSKDKDTSVGIQIEENEYRWFMHKSHKPNQIIQSKKHKEEIAIEYFRAQRDKYNKWFNDDKLYRYITEAYTFIYQRKESVKSNTTFEELISRVTKDLMILLNEGYLKESND